MIPKINKYEFYLYSDFSDGDNPLNLIQLIAHSNEYVDNVILSPAEQKIFSKRIQLCEMLFEDEWTSRNGKIPFFFEFPERKDVEDYYKKLILFANEFQFESEIPNLKKTLEFYIENEAEIKELGENQEDDDWWDKTQALEDKYNAYYSQTLEIVANQIIKNPDNFCRDEQGNSINPNYTGKYKEYLKNGILKCEYSVVNGQILGEYTEYDNDGNKRKLSFKEGCFDEETIKSWHSNGQIEFEKINDSDYRYWYDNGQMEMERISDVVKKWNRNGEQIR
ncbi:hypothetical protein AAG747_21565 [Rapidithrix thailandica]|uniref:Uncharacterized protein n=1 Tax=Rapidithrix thailandica TaxID=413964 RepID=A0AAW9S9F7_9BACT